MFAKKNEEAQKEYGVGKGDRFKLKEGSNKIRILAGGEPIATHWIANKGYTCFGKDKGCSYHGENAPKDKNGKEIKVSVKFAVYLLDKIANDDIIHLLFLPWSVIKALDDFTADSDYKFESLPMPYDITVKYDPETSPAEMYKVIPSPKREEVSAEILEKLSKMKLTKDIVSKIKIKAQEEINGKQEEQEEIDPANINF